MYVTSTPGRSTSRSWRSITTGHVCTTQPLGRFYTPDPAGQQNSAYAYAGNNPISFVDPTGELFGIDDIIVVMVVGAVVGVVSEGISAYIEANNNIKELEKLRNEHYDRTQMTDKELEQLKSQEYNKIWKKALWGGVVGGLASGAGVALAGVGFGAISTAALTGGFSGVLGEFGNEMINSENLSAGKIFGSALTGLVSGGLGAAFGGLAGSTASKVMGTTAMISWG